MRPIGKPSTLDAPISSESIHVGHPGELGLSGMGIYLPFDGNDNFSGTHPDDQMSNARNTVLDPDGFNLNKSLPEVNFHTGTDPLGNHDFSTRGTLYPPAAPSQNPNFLASDYTSFFPSGFNQVMGDTPISSVKKSRFLSSNHPTRGQLQSFRKLTGDNTIRKRTNTGRSKMLKVLNLLEQVKKTLPAGSKKTSLLISQLEESVAEDMLEETRAAHNQAPSQKSHWEVDSGYHSNMSSALSDGWSITTASDMNGQIMNDVSMFSDWSHDEGNIDMTMDMETPRAIEPSPPEYHCTFISTKGKLCNRVAKCKGDWIKHEESEMHWPQKKYMCMLCIDLLEDEDRSSLCSFCFEHLPATGSNKGHYLECAKARRGKHCFAAARKDHFRNHLRNHDMPDIDAEAATWVFNVESDWPRDCGFCTTRFTSWNERAHHVASHFQQGMHISSWKLPTRKPQDFGHTRPGLDYKRDEDEDEDDDDNRPDHGGGSARKSLVLQLSSSEGSNNQSQSSMDSSDDWGEWMHGEMFDEDQQHRSCVERVEEYLDMQPRFLGQLILSAQPIVKESVETPSQRSLETHISSEINPSLPPRNQDFVGREDILESLKQALLPSSSVASSMIFVIHGLGGVGKSQVALEYAHRHKELYDHIFWMKAETAKSFSESYTKVLSQLDLANGQSFQDDERSISLLHDWLHNTKENWLMILDGLDGVCEPSTLQQICNAKGSVLVTTRLSDLKVPLNDSNVIGIQDVDLGGLPIDICWRMLEETPTLKARLEDLAYYVDYGNGDCTAERVKQLPLTTTKLSQFVKEVENLRSRDCLERCKQDLDFLLNKLLDVNLTKTEREPEHRVKDDVPQSPFAAAVNSQQVDDIETLHETGSDPNDFLDQDRLQTFYQDLSQETGPDISSNNELKPHLLGLSPEMDQPYKFLVDRIAHQHTIRLKSLLEMRVPVVWEDSITEPCCNVLIDKTIPSGTATLWTPGTTQRECQSCFKAKKFQVPSDSPKHVRKDKQPSNCTYDLEEPKYFKRKAEWLRHEDERHRHLEWRAPQVDDGEQPCELKNSSILGLQYTLGTYEYDAALHQDTEYDVRDTSDTDYLPKCKRRRFTKKFSASNTKYIGVQLRGLTELQKNQAQEAREAKACWACHTSKTTYSTCSLGKSRAFVCVFAFAGCSATFASKNEWKKHVSTQHLKLDRWNPAIGCASNPHFRDSQCRTSTAEFNRKDPFMQHLQRMHTMISPAEPRQRKHGDRARAGYYSQKPRSRSDASNRLKKGTIFAMKHPQTFHRLPPDFESASFLRIQETSVAAMRDRMSTSRMKFHLPFLALRKPPTSRGTLSKYPVERLLLVGGLLSPRIRLFLQRPPEHRVSLDKTSPWEVDRSNENGIAHYRDCKEMFNVIHNGQRFSFSNDETLDLEAEENVSHEQVSCAVPRHKKWQWITCTFDATAYHIEVAIKKSNATIIALACEYSTSLLLSGITFNPDTRRFHDIRQSSGKAWEPHGLECCQEVRSDRSDRGDGGVTGAMGCVSARADVIYNDGNDVELCDDEELTLSSSPCLDILPRNPESWIDSRSSEGKFRDSGIIGVGDWVEDESVRHAMALKFCLQGAAASLFS